MHGRRRNRYAAYFLLLLGFISFCYIIYGYSKRHLKMAPNPRLFEPLDYASFDEFTLPIHSFASEKINMFNQCTMNQCFNMSKCIRSFKVYILDSGSGYSSDFQRSSTANSERYSKILTAIKESVYYTENPNEACLFVLGLDTLDRDPLSPDYIKHFQKRINEIPNSLWNNGQNHLIFNLYSGSWPDYIETDWGFAPGMALLAKASFSFNNFRNDFDISLPLFHAVLPLRGGESIPIGSALHFPTQDSYFLIFKGKRYVYGMGSNTRNSLHLLHNQRDIVMLTTCKHGKTWKEMQDERCVEDNDIYEKWDYNLLINNATFCLVPRGRRLGSFRFLEALQAGCIPVILSNEWELPFSDIIDWKSAVVLADEDLLLQVVDLVRSISPENIFRLRQNAQSLYRLYFSSVQNIVFTTIEIIRDRIERWKSRSSTVWNQNLIGGLHLSSANSDKIGASSFNIPVEQTPYFTAIIDITYGANLKLSRLITNIVNCRYAKKIILLLSDPNISIPKFNRLQQKISLETINTSEMDSSAKFTLYKGISTPFIVNLNNGVDLSTDEIEFGLEVLRWFPERLVGYFSLSHHWDIKTKSWKCSSKLMAHYSMLRGSAILYHRYYNYLYANSLTSSMYKIANDCSDCQDILFNMMVSRITGRSPMKLTHKNSQLNVVSPFNASQLMLKRNSCLNLLVKLFGYMPLQSSKIRFDPVLFKDPVSNYRRKFHLLDPN